MKTPDPTTAAPTIELVLITGMSGSGKSVALTALEDLGYYCVDNLPPELLLPFVQIEHSHGARKVAIAIDVRSAASLPGLPERLNQLRSQPEHGVHLRTVFLDSTTDTLVRRFSETRRRHPLSLRPREDDRHNALIDAIEQERELLSDLRDQALVFDTSIMLPSELRTSIKSFVGVSHPGLTLVFESFAFKRGVPVDADFVFDVRMLPNPHYDPQLRPQTGRDKDVTAYLDAQADVQRMAAQIDGFLRHWLPAMQSDHRSYVTVAVGCTGGQHRSVYLAERLGAAFGAEWATRVRHREAGHWPATARTDGQPSP